MNVVLVGPSIAQRGGVVSVIKSLQLFLKSRNLCVHTVATTTEKGSIYGALIFLRAWISVIGACTTHRADVIHLHMASKGSCFRKSILGLTCWAFRTPFVIHLHGGRFSIFYEKELGPIGRKFVGFVLRRATSVIALSETWQEWLKTTIHLKKVVVVFNGVPSYTRTTKGTSAPTILFLGRLSKNKGTAELITSMLEVIKKIPDSVLELGGDGDIESYRKLSLDTPNIKFLGWIDEAERQAALARASIYCLPSWNEGLPMSILEAMSAGLPVVSTPVGGIPEAITDGVTGFLVQPGDTKGLTTALSKLLLDPELATVMGKNGQACHRERFSADSMGNSCLEVYASCLK